MSGLGFDDGLHRRGAQVPEPEVRKKRNADATIGNGAIGWSLRLTLCGANARERTQWDFRERLRGPESDQRN
eukprot:6508638-Pyramimonas_sp.AAC.1